MAPKLSDEEKSDIEQIDEVLADPVEESKVDDDESDGGLFGSDDEEEPKQAADSDAMDEAEDVPQKVLDVSLPRHEKSHEPTKDTILFRLPAFLSIDAKPFDPKVFLEKTEEGHGAQQESGDALNERRRHEKLIAENTIRWRYAKNENDVLYKQSNSQIIEWEDGSMSLKLGNEIFDIKGRSVDDSVLAVADFDQTVLRTDAVLNKSVKVVPVSTMSQTHRKLTKAITAMQKIQRAGKINSIVTEDDPLKMQREEEKKEQQKLKEIRRRQRQELEANEAASTPPPSKGYYSRYSGIDVADDDDDDEDVDDEAPVRRSRLGDGYDDDDGFIIQDDEEEEVVDDEDDEDELDRAAERLRKVKQDGVKKYQDDEEKESSDDAEKLKRKKRRVIVDDDDEDDE